MLLRFISVLLILSAISLSSCKDPLLYRKHKGQKKVVEEQCEINHLENEAEEITEKNRKDYTKEEKKQLKERKQEAKKEADAAKKKDKNGKPKKINNGVFNFY